MSDSAPSEPIETIDFSRSDAEVLQRNARDLVLRMRAGIFIYPIIWFIVALGSNLFSTDPVIVISISIALVVLTLIRFFHLQQLTQINFAQIPKWLRQVTLLMLPHSLIWGAMLGYALTHDNTTFALLMTFSTAGIVPGGVYNFAPNYPLASLFVLSIMLPTLLGAIVADQWFMLGLSLVYTGYILLMAKGQNRDYWRALENEHKLKKQTRTDPLTQLDNRRCFDEKLSEFCHLSSRNHELLTVMLVDCDHFKQVNDTYGHDVGDQCLRHIAQTIRTHLPRATDVVARYGGEEFSLILPGTDLAGAIKVSERLRAALAASTIPLGEQTLTVTASIGTVSRRLNRFEQGLPEELFKQADNALYQAKSAGRNRCVHYFYDPATAAYQQA
ncbi:MAG: GGDEF domain-containing protein [Gammaproteobacteria bacterium]|nr:GGDEF domain-containing protein [Gammaproteobacteria bacterium]